MTRREVKRLHVIRQALDKRITQNEAAGLIGVSDRQIRRLIKRIRREGDAGLCHKSRGRASNRRICPKIKHRALKLFRERYRDFNLTHATEKLDELHAINISAETLRLWLNEAKLPYKKRKVREHRQRRQPKAHFGELVQIDGSHHDWLEGRGPICVFMGYIDDATNTVYGRFYDYEGTMPAMDSMKRYIRLYGIPQSVYVDKHATYKSWAEPTLEEQLNDQKPMSHFEKSLTELGVEVIHANSPQAKGRVERLFKTLQDRLVKEMRLAGIKSVQEANEFLDTYLAKHNKRFRKAAASDADLHRPAPHSRELDRVLCIKEERVVKNDFTIAYNGKLYQIKEPSRAQKVTVEERLNGTIHISYKGQELKYREIIKEPIKMPDALVLLSARKSIIPSSDHPWKRAYKALRKKQEPTLAAP